MLGQCPSPSSGASIGGGGVDVWAHQRGGSGHASPGDHGESVVDRDAGSGGGDATHGRGYFVPGDPECEERGMVCRDYFTVTSPETDPVVQSTVITLADLARFAPAPPAAHMEPPGWIATGLDTNFYTDASAQTVNGTLLGYPVSVRFTPVAFHWSYGDGSTATVDSPGASWAVLGVPEFSKTDTSHIYDDPGRYTISLTVDYAAAYRFAGLGWQSVSGTLPLTADALSAIADNAKTVLVGNDCTADPSGPGC